MGPLPEKIAKFFLVANMFMIDSKSIREEIVQVNIQVLDFKKVLQPILMINNVSRLNLALLILFLVHGHCCLTTRVQVTRTLD